MLQLALFLLLVVSWRVFVAASGTTASDESDHGVERKEIPSLREDSPTIKTHLPRDVILHIYSMVVRNEAFSLMLSQKPAFDIRHPLFMAEILAWYSNYEPFTKMSLGPDLFELILTAEIMQDRFHFVLSENSVLWFRSAVMIDYVNAMIFENPSINTEDKRMYFAEFARDLYMHGEFTALGHLIMIATDDIVFFTDEPWSVKNMIARKLPVVNSNSALKLCRLLANKHVELFVHIFLTPMNESQLAEAMEILSSHTSKLKFGEEILRCMDETANDYTEYFSHVTWVSYKNNMTLLDSMGALAPNDSAHCFKVLRVRLQYLIRFQPILKNAVINDACEDATASTSDGVKADDTSVTLRIDDALLKDMALELLSKLDQFTDSKCNRFKLLTTSIHAENRELFWIFWAGASAIDECYLKLIIDNPKLEKLLSFSEYKAMSDKSHYLQTMRFCKATTGKFPDDKWICTFDAPERLLIFAEMQDVSGFEEAVKLIVQDKPVTLAKVMDKIIKNMNNPVPFVKIILSTGHSKLYTESLRMPNFLNAILLDKSDDDSIFQLLNDYMIRPRSPFFNDLLDDQTLARSFQHRKGRLLRRHIRFSGIVLSSKFVNHIVKLFRILCVPLIMEHAFNLEGDESEIREKTQNLVLKDTLDDLDRQAEEPGFLAYLALSYSKPSITHTFNRPYVTFRMLNPLDFAVFNLLRTYWAHNKTSFNRCADWRIVISFYAAKPDEESWKAARGEVYPVSLMEIAKTHFHDREVVFEFPSERTKARFEREVLPVIGDVLQHVKCIVAPLGLEMSDLFLDEDRNGLERI